MKHGSLFNGIGGFQLAAEWMSWENIFSCEIDQFCNRVTKYHFPNCKQYYDIKETDFRRYKGQIDILTGGFPCQPFSVAGKQIGTEDERNLWHEMHRAVKEIQPRWIVAENVLGIVSWNGGMVFEQVQADLENEGYEVLSFLLPAAGVNAPHRRERVWIVAYSNFSRDSRKSRKYEISGKKKGVQKWNKVQLVEKSNNLRKSVADSPNARAEGVQQGRENGIHELEIVANTIRKRRGKILQNLQSEFADGESSYSFNEPGNWQNFPTQPPICGGDDGLPKELDSLTFPKWRSESIKAYGNAIVPQVAFQIFKAIQNYETNT